MQKSNIISAIDIGTTKIVAVIGQRTDSGKYEILGVGRHQSNGVRRGVVLNIEETVQSIESAVRQAEEQAGVKMKEVYVGIAGEHIRSRRSSGYIQLGADEDEITEIHTQRLEEQMFNTAIDMGEEIIHVLPQKYTIDQMQGVDNPVGVAGKRLEGSFHIIIGQINAANNIKKCVTRVGLKVKKLILEPLASSKAVLTADEREAGVIMIDIGGGTTDIAVYKDRAISHTAVIPLGGYSVTNDIKLGCSILERHAEKLKVQFGSALQSGRDKNKVVKIPGISGRPHKEISFHHLAGIIQARMEEIIEEVVYELDSNDLRDGLGAGIVVSGGGSMLKNLPQLISFRTGMETRIGKPRIPLVAESGKNLSDPTLSTAIGLIMEGYEDMNGKMPRKKTKQATIFSFDDEPEKEMPVEEKKETTSNKKSSLGGKMKDLFADFFDMKDTEM